MHNLPKHHNTKSQSIGSNHCSKSVGCSKWDERVKERSIIETTGKQKKTYNFKQDTYGIFFKNSMIQIYASPRQFYDLSKIFECRNKAARLCNQKPNMPCVCEDCGLMGIIRDSQNMPFVNEVICPSRNKERRQERQNTREMEQNSKTEKRNKRNLKEEHSHCHEYIQLLDRIKDLEQRLQIHEATAVPKAEFKQIIYRLLTRLAAYKNQGKTCTSTQCEELPKSSRDQERSFCSKKSSITTSKYFWKWGEEILKPGTDIKNKILLLIEDTLKKISQGINKPNQCSKILLADTFNKIPQNASAVLETKTPISIEKNVHCSDTSLRISYINPCQWGESESSLKSTSSDVNLSRISNNLQDTYKEKFITMVNNSSQEERQRVWNAVWEQCLMCGCEKCNIAAIHFPQRKGKERIRVDVTIKELKSILIDKKSGTM